jgi:hypothetical protein
MTQNTEQPQPQSPIQVVASPGPDGIQVGVVAAAGGLQVLLRIHVDQADQIADALAGEIKRVAADIRVKTSPLLIGNGNAPQIPLSDLFPGLPPGDGR